MKSVYIASTQGSGGKTTMSVGLCLAMRKHGLNVGYFKPVGTLAAHAGDALIDEDASFVADLLGLTEDPRDICPVVLDEDALHDLIKGAEADAMSLIERPMRASPRAKISLFAKGWARSGKAASCALAAPRSLNVSISGSPRRQVRRRAPARRHLLRQGRPQATPSGCDLQHGAALAHRRREERIH